MIEKGHGRSVFCLSPAGDTPSSARLFDAIVSGCIPVVVSDELELPFEGILDYQQVISQHLLPSVICSMLSLKIEPFQLIEAAGFLFMLLMHLCTRKQSNLK